MKLTLIFSVLLAVALSLGSMSTALAQEPGQASAREGFVGTVSSYQGTTLVLDTREGQVEFEVTGETSVTAASSAAATGVAPLIEQGASVVVLAQSMDGGWQAIHVVINPDEVSVPPATGVVVSFENGLLTILLPTGETKTFEVPEGFDAPAVGETATVVARLKAGASMDEPPVMTGFRTAAQIQTRLEGFLEDVDEGPGPHQQVRDRIAQLLERHATLHVQILERLRDNGQIQNAVRDSVLDALENAEQARDRVQGVLGVVGGNDGTEDDAHSTGIVASITEAALVLEDGTTFTINDSTRIGEGVAAGVAVMVEANPDGSLIAVEVQAEGTGEAGGTDTAAEEVTITGTVLHLGSTRLILTDRTMFAINIDTAIDNGIGTGTQVEVKGFIANGRLVATAITIADGSGDDQASGN